MKFMSFIFFGILFLSFALFGIMFFTYPSGRQEVQSGDFLYTSSRSAVTITRYIGAGGAVVVPDRITIRRGTGAPVALPVKVIGAGAFHARTNLTSVTLPNGVAAIGDSAFSSCTDLTSVILPDGLTTIGGFAFYGCTNLTSVLLPNGLTRIGDTTFYECTRLASVSIPDSVTSIGRTAFYGCRGLTSVIIPNRVTSIGSSAFSGCRSLTELTIGNRVKTIGDSAFSECAGLTSVTLPASVTSIGRIAFQCCSGLTSVTLPDCAISIGEQAFYDCRSLTSVSIPARVASIGTGAFRDCRSLSAIDVSVSNRNYASVDGVLFNKARTVLMQYPTGKQGASYVVPDGVTTIDVFVFEGCRGLTSVTLPASVTTISYGAVWYCSVTSVRLLGLCPTVKDTYVSDMTDKETGFVGFATFFNEGKEDGVFDPRVTVYVERVHLAAWDALVSNGPIEGGNAMWRGRPIRLFPATAGAGEPQMHASTHE
ncbi:MAG: leucine-rich repeat domain-containing protein [Verrucomicrobiota bacterium]|nr:leucine-rich repeat domain-containing protein [Verrucomicrobiota bacterium]